jgi:hypothetical protein
MPVQGGVGLPRTRTPVSPGPDPAQHNNSLTLKGLGFIGEAGSEKGCGGGAGGQRHERVSNGTLPASCGLGCRKPDTSARRTFAGEGAIARLSQPANGTSGGGQSGTSAPGPYLTAR